MFSNPTRTKGKGERLGPIRQFPCGAPEILTQKGRQKLCNMPARTPVFRTTFGNLMPGIRNRLHLYPQPLTLFAYRSQGRNCLRTRSSSRIKVKLPNLIKQGLITDSKHLGCVFAAPVCFL
jgi:hypothetical protein